MEGEFGPYAAFCFDQAVTTFGRALEAELDSVNEKTTKGTVRKRERILQKWLDVPLKFKSPMGPTAQK